MSSGKRNSGQVMRRAFLKSIPIMCSYLFVSMAYGMMMENAGYHWYYSLLACFTVIKIFLEQPTRLPQFPPFQQFHALLSHVRISVSYKYGSKHVSCVRVLPLFVVLVSVPA